MSGYEGKKILKKIKCPKCKSKHLSIDEIWDVCCSFETDTNGKVINVWSEDGAPSNKIVLRCQSCSHTWKRAGTIHDFLDW